MSQVSKLGSMVQAIELATKNKSKSNSTITSSLNSDSESNALDSSLVNSNKTRACPVTADTFIEKLLPKIEHKDSVKTESAIADVAQDLFPELNLEVNKPEPKAKIKQGASGKVTITLTLTAEQNEKLQKVLAKKSHSIVNGDINKLFEKLLNKELKGYELKPERDSEPQSNSASSYTTETTYVTKAEPDLMKKSVKKRKYISVKIRRRVFAKANHQCQYLSPLTGERCSEKNFLTIDHLKPLALGGTDDELNYQCYCSSHNLAEARRMGIAGEYQTTVTSRGF